MPVEITKWLDLNNYSDFMAPYFLQLQSEPFGCIHDITGTLVLTMGTLVLTMSVTYTIITFNH